MADKNLEDLILSGESSLNLMAKGFTSEQQGKASSDIEKKNADVNVKQDGGVSPSEDGSSESYLSDFSKDLVDQALTRNPILSKNAAEYIPDSEPSIVSNTVSEDPRSPDFYVKEAPLVEEDDFFDKKRVVPGRSRETTALLTDSYGSIIGNVENRLKSEAILKQINPSGELNPMQAMREAYNKDPKNPSFRAEMIVGAGIERLIENQPEYTEELKKKRKNISDLEKQLNDNNFKSIEVPAGYGAGMESRPFVLTERSAEDQRKIVEKSLESSKKDLLRFQESKTKWELQKVITEAYRKSLGDEDLNDASKGPGSDMFAMEPEVQAWFKRQSRIKALEPLLLNDYGIYIDINDDGIIGNDKIDLDNDLALMGLQALDLAVYTGITFSRFSGDKMRRDYALWSQGQRKSLTSSQTVLATTFDEWYEHGDEYRLDRSLLRFREFLGDAVESLPFTLASMAATAAGGPGVGIAAASTLAGMKTYAESLLDPSFDDFYLFGERVVPHENMGLSSRINDFYKSEDFVIQKDEMGFYIELPASDGLDGTPKGLPTRVDVVVNDLKRWGFSFAEGLAEGTPEAIGSSVMLKAAKRGSFTSFGEGFGKQFGLGSVNEFAQESSTSVLNILDAAAIKGEYLSGTEAMSRVIRGGVTGSISGGPMQSSMYSYNMVRITPEQRKALYRGNEVGGIKAVASSKDLDALKKIKVRIEDPETSVEEKQVLSEQLNSLSDKITKDNEELNRLVSETSKTNPEAAADLVEAANELRATNDQAQNRKGKNKFSETDAILSDRVDKAEKKFSEALSKAKGIAGSMAFAGSQVSQESSRAEQISKDLISVDEVAKALGVSSEKAQELIDNDTSTASAVVVASNLVAKDPGKIKVFSSEEDYLKAVEDGVLSDRQGSLAQFMPNGEIHLAPGAKVVDIIEEVIHREISESGLTEEQIDEMYEELNSSDNEFVSAIIALRASVYEGGDAKEEAVVGVLREGLNLDFNNENLKALQEKISKDYAVESFVKRAAPDQGPISDQQRYSDLQDNYAKAGRQDLERRLGREPFEQFAREIGLDPSNDLTLKEVEDLTIHALNNAPFSVDALSAKIVGNAEYNEKVMQRPEIQREIDNGKIVPVVTVRQDGTGTVTFVSGSKRIDIERYSGVDSEEAMAERTERGKVGQFAMSDQKQVQAMINRLYVGSKYSLQHQAEMLGLKLSDKIVINIEQMGPDAIKSGSIVSQKMANNMYSVLKDENSTPAQKASVIRLLDFWLEGLVISTRQTDVGVIKSKPGRSSSVNYKSIYKTVESVDRKSQAEDFIREQKSGARLAAEEVETGPTSERIRSKAETSQTFVTSSTSGTVRFSDENKTWKSFDPTQLGYVLDLRKGTSKEKEFAAIQLLNYLAFNDGLETGLNITFSERGNLIEKVGRELSDKHEGLVPSLEDIKSDTRSDLFKDAESREKADKKIVAAIVGTKAGIKAQEVTFSGVDQTEVQPKTDYGYGIPLKNAEVIRLETPVSIEELTVDEKIGDRSNITRNNAPKIVLDYIASEAVADKAAAIDDGGVKNSKFMGMPDAPFTMNYTERSTNIQQTKQNVNFLSKTFQDGWHFWNWWVQQTGNGKIDTISGWNYQNENGEKVILGKIPQKKDRKNGGVLSVEPLYKTWQSKSIERNRRDMAASIQSRKQAKIDYEEAIEGLEEKIKDTPYGLGSLEYWVGVSEFGRSSSVEQVEAMSNMSDVIVQANSLEAGQTLEWKPRTYNQLETSDLTSVELASSFVNSESLILGKMRNFHRKFNFLNNMSEGISHTAEKTDKGWKLGVNLSLPSSSESLVDGFKKPYTKDGLRQAVNDLEAGRKHDDSDAKSSKIMPPRYYELREDRGGYQGTIDFLNGWMVNKYADILGLQEKSEEKFGKVGATQNFNELEQLMYGRSRYAMEKLDQKMQNAREFMKENGLTHTDLSQYMYARHAAERNEHISKKRPDLIDGSGMSNEMAEEILSEFDTSQMKEAAAMFDAILDDTRMTMLKQGLETTDRLKSWIDLYENYVPLQGFAEDEMDPGTNSYPTGGAGMSVYGSKVKAAIGRESEAANVLANIVMQNAVTHQWAEKNRVLRGLHDLVSTSPMEDVWSIVDNKKPLTKLDENGKQTGMTVMEMQADRHTVPVRVDGEQKFIYFKDPYYADVLNGMTMEQTNTFLRAMRAPVSWLRGVFTQWDPNFFVSNFARDIGGSIYNASADVEGGAMDDVNTKGFKRKMMGNTFRSLQALLGQSVRGKELPQEMQVFYDEWREDGGQTGWNFIKDLKEIEAQLAVDSDDLTRGKQLREKLFSSPKKFFSFVEGVNDAFENSIRLSSYMTARQQGASRQQAAVFSKNITVNFNRQGEAGPAINTMYLFFNAAIQGNKRVYESMTTLKPAKKADGSTREWHERATGAQKTAAGMAGFSGMLTLLNLALCGKDPEDDELWYNKLSEYDKQRNMIICYGKGKDDFLKVPLPYGFGLFNNMGSALAETSTGNRTPNSAMMFLGMSAFSSFSPISFGGDLENPGTFVLRSFAPTTLKPFVELAENKTYFGSPITGEQLPFGTQVPSSELSFRAPKEMQNFFKWMNEATGGSQFKEGWADFNPDHVYYLFEYMIGGSGDFIMSSGEQARNLYEMSKRSLEKAKDSRDVGQLIKSLGYGFSEEGEVRINYNDVPIVKKIYGEASPFYDIERFKDNTKEVEQLYREIREEKIVTNSPGRYKGVQALHEEYKSSQKTLKSLRSALREARDIEDYIDRQNRVFDIYEAQRKVMARYNKKFKQLRGED